MDRSNQHMVTAAFFMEGLHDACYAETIHAWDKGVVGLIEEMVNFVPYMTDMALEYAKTHEYPGVFDYEVSVPFGKWFAEYLQDKGDIPDTSQCHAKIKDMVEAFFLQSEVLGEEMVSVAKKDLVQMIEGFRNHVQDVKEGLDDGTYSMDDNADFPLKEKVLQNMDALLGN